MYIMTAVPSYNDILLFTRVWIII